MDVCVSDFVSSRADRPVLSGTQESRSTAHRDRSVLQPVQRQEDMRAAVINNLTFYLQSLNDTLTNQTELSNYIDSFFFLNKQTKKKDFDYRTFSQSQSNNITALSYNSAIINNSEIWTFFN